jgi:folylpolyglutamate synthase
MFAKYFFEIWDPVKDHSKQHGNLLPGYLQLLLILSLHTFIQEGVDAAVYEAHSGGEYCATNCLKPVVTGITTLGLDHSDVLGPSFESVAWHKAGIFKPGTPAYSSPQRPEAAKVLELRAAEKDVPLVFVKAETRLPVKAEALEPEIQRVNAGLAYTLTNELLKATAPTSNACLTPQDIFHAIKAFSWPGRFHSIINGNDRWLLDVAHNEISLKIAAHWFARTIQRYICSLWLIKKLY